MLKLTPKDGRFVANCHINIGYKLRCAGAGGSFTLYKGCDPHCCGYNGR